MLDAGWPLNLDRAGPAWAWFDAAHYGKHDAIAAGAARQSDAAALADFEARGAALGYAPNFFFDAPYYLRHDPGLAASIAAGDTPSAYEHYRTMGWRDRSPHWLFDIVRYRSLNPDLTPENVEMHGGFYGHYLLTGAAEHRTAHFFFDPAYYLARLPHDEHEQARSDPFGHLLHTFAHLADDAARPEPQCSYYFDPAWYVATYPDVIYSALHHYLTFGAAEGRDPIYGYSEADYRALNPDVEAAIVAGYFPSGFAHFLSYGVAGARSPSRDVDLAWYAAQPLVARDLAAKLQPDPFLHMLAIGIPAGLPLRGPVAPDFAPAEKDAQAQFTLQAQRALPGFGRRPLDFTVAGQPQVSVIIVLLNHFALTMQALASLRHTFPGGIELIIVDNASSDGTRAIADLVHGARLIRLEENIGFLRACNMALPHATAPAVLYLNNDVILQPGAIQAALDRLAAEPTAGAVGGKIIRTHGLLQEAGCVLWRDGSAAGYMRDALPDAPEANYVRDVDYCSGCFLMVRGPLLRELGGFDEAFAPAYYEEVDLCLCIQAAGYRVVYDPAVALTHYEYASARSGRAAVALMVANRPKLRARHASALGRRVADQRRRAEAAAGATAGRRVLFIEDTIPLSRLGSGYGRAADALCALVAAGWQATVFPLVPVRTPTYHITAALPETAELLWDRNVTMLGAFLEDRPGYYDLVWVSRAHNLRQVAEIMHRSGTGLGGARLVLDTEAVFSLRDAARAQLDDLPFGLDTALTAEFDGAWLCDHVVAVNETEAAVLRGLQLPSVGVVGFNVTPAMTDTPWNERRGLLHIGALTAPDSPNVEGLRWFLDHVHPETPGQDRPRRRPPHRRRPSRTRRSISAGCAITPASHSPAPSPTSHRSMPRIACSSPQPGSRPACPPRCSTPPRAASRSPAPACSRSNSAGPRAARCSPPHQTMPAPLPPTSPSSRPTTRRGCAPATPRRNQSSRSLAHRPSPGRWNRPCRPPAPPPHHNSDLLNGHSGWR